MKMTNTIEIVYGQEVEFDKVEINGEEIKVLYNGTVVSSFAVEGLIFAEVRRIKNFRYKLLLTVKTEEHKTGAIQDKWTLEHQERIKKITKRNIEEIDTIHNDIIRLENEIEKYRKDIRELKQQNKELMEDM